MRKRNLIVVLSILLILLICELAFVIHMENEEQYQLSNESYQGEKMQDPSISAGIEVESETTKATVPASAEMDEDELPMVTAPMQTNNSNDTQTDGGESEKTPSDKKDDNTSSVATTGVSQETEGSRETQTPQSTEITQETSNNKDEEGTQSEEKDENELPVVPGTESATEPVPKETESEDELPLVPAM